MRCVDLVCHKTNTLKPYDVISCVTAIITLVNSERFVLRVFFFESNTSTRCKTYAATFGTKLVQFCEN